MTVPLLPGACAPADTAPPVSVLSAPVLVMAAHGTRSAVGIDTTQQLAGLVRSMRPELDVRVSFVDVAAPVFADVVAGVTGPLTVVPVLLSGGYHVHIDIPNVLRARADAVVAPALGPDRSLSLIMAQRLAFARGDRPGAGAGVVLVSTGSSDAAARGDVVSAAADLAEVLGEPVRAAYMTGPQADLEAALRQGPTDVVSYLLAPGSFFDRLRRLGIQAGALTVTEPLGVHPGLAQLILRRYDEARRN